MPRETKTIKTPSGADVEYYAYLTGKESRELQKVFLSSASFEADEKSPQPKGSFKATAITDTQALSIKILVVSVNGNKEGAAEAVDAMRVEDYNAVVVALNEIVKPVFSTQTDFLGK